MSTFYCLKLNSIIAIMVSTMVSALLVAASIACVSAGTWTDLRAHLPSPNMRQNYFYRQLPRTANDANDLGWVAPWEESKDSLTCTLPYTVLCPFQDPSICALYDKNGFIAGMEFGIVKYNAAPAYPFASNSAFASKKRFGYDSYIATVFFIDQAVLNNGGRSNIADNGTGTGIWLQNGRNSMLAVPMAEPDSSSAFIKQQCVSGEGVKYQQTATACEVSLPIVPIYQDGQLSGFAFQAFGSATPTGQKNWMETIPSETYKASVTNSPACMSTWADTYGLVSVHIFFTATPWLNSCPAPIQADAPVVTLA